MKKRSRRVLTVLLAMAFLSVPAFAEEDLDPNSAAQKARKSHEMAESDMIYQQEDFKALYYQNIQMIDLLKEIRDSLQVIKERASEKNTENKSL